MAGGEGVVSIEALGEQLQQRRIDEIKRLSDRLNAARSSLSGSIRQLVVQIRKHPTSRDVAIQNGVPTEWLPVIDQNGNAEAPAALNDVERHGLDLTVYLPADPAKRRPKPLAAADLQLLREDIRLRAQQIREFSNFTIRPLEVRATMSVPF